MPASVPDVGPRRRGRSGLRSPARYAPNRASFREVHALLRLRGWPKRRSAASQGRKELTMNNRAFFLAAALLSACAANPKKVTSSTDITAGASASAPAPATTDSCSLVRIRFAFDSSLLDGEAQRLLREDADCLSKRRATALLIEGH